MMEPTPHPGAKYVVRGKVVLVQSIARWATKSTVQGHLNRKKHAVAIETMKKREKARVECRLEVEGVTPLLLNHRRRV